MGALIRLRWPCWPLNRIRCGQTPIQTDSTVLHDRSVIKFEPRLCPAMAGGGVSSSYEEALNCLSSLKTQRNPADTNNTGDNSDLMYDYLKILDLEDPISRFKVIHVAGTKGKGSTCTFIESILRHCGFRTALYTSPHLIDLRERFQLDGVEISEEKFLTSFWWCWDRLKEKCDAVVPMPSLFRLLTLLAFKIFSEEQVDVVVLEVGIGGKFDATNVVRAPIVCGISSLGYDHMEILGNTLGEISGEKAGIFKQGVPAFTVPQPEEAMSVLEAKASELGIPLQVAAPLDIGSLNGQRLGLDGEHQYLNAGLAVALSRTWLIKTGHTEGVYLNHTSILPDQFIRGLTMAHLQGRAQIIPDPYVNIPNQNLSHGGLVFYLDGAHTPESLETCAKWFSHVIRKDMQELENLEEQHHDRQNARQILLFNCMSLRDPHLLLPRLKNACAHNGVCFYKALFVPNQYHKVSFHAATPTTDPQQVDLSWQLTLQRVWENLIHGKNGGGDDKVIDYNEARKHADLSNTMALESSSVFPSIPLAIEWLRKSVEQNRSIHFQVLVTGSMQLVGDVLRLIKK